MPDQSVKITSLPDNSAARVAFDLYNALRIVGGLHNEPSGPDAVTKNLNLYARCFNATRGYDHTK